ncbi:Siderophore iron transporter mirB [Neonectria ditissima]|uniref:Siderophore iron transporter mirB n=1 Tax=Neonectria ditissima TaxID=78410 RepID=A0A0P7BKC2_9HYPO|nr:Siderophore iron transporter mirB [Neonectria ditissima]
MAVAAEVAPQVAPTTPPDAFDESGAQKEAGGVIDETHAGSDSEEPIHKDAQAGVQNMEAITTVWTKTALITAYAMIWVIYFIETMQSGTTSSLSPYVTSAFQAHSLTPTVSIFSSIIGGVFKLTLAKILDVFGRPQGYALSVCMLTLGLVMMAACNAVETYAAAQVFYWIGYNGLDYSLSIFIADTSHLKNRGLMFAYASSPYIITTWLGGRIAESFLKGPGFRWGFGVFCIVMPVVTMPLFGLFMYYYYKAKNMGLVPKRETKRTIPQSIMYYAREFDLIGLLLISAGISLFLLPFNIYSYQKEQWRAPIIICFLVFGFLLIVSFAIWEKFFAPVKFLPYHLFLDRTFMGACILAGSVFVSFYCWDGYFGSFLQVVNDLSITEASYVANIYTIGSCLWSIVVGLFIRKTGNFKWICLGFGVPFTILGVGLMLKFRQPDVNIGYIVMCQIFIAFAGGTIVICEQTAAMAAVSHQYVAVVIAVEGMFANIGGGIGSSIAAAIWQGVFPKALGKYLPAEEQGNLTLIYEDLTVQLSYPVGSVARHAIQQAYADAQRMMLIAGTAVLAISFFAVAFWRDINVKERKQVKGRVV